MRVLLQRVSQASVTVDGHIVGEIGPGLLLLVGVGHGDSEREAEWLAEKVAGLRLFADDEGKMNRAVTDVGGSALVVSQFTLYGDASRGRRPSFTEAGPPALANRLYEHFAAHLARLGVPVARGVFQADMKVALVNDGPVTLMLERSPSD